jgi:hypothetical protein
MVELLLVTRGKAAATVRAALLAGRALASPLTGRYILF